MLQRPKSQGGLVVPHQADWLRRAGAWAVYLACRLLAATIRFRLRDESGLHEHAAPGPMIFAIWHNRLALSLVLYRKFVLNGRPPRALAAMVSASRDGGFLASILKRFQVQPVRGSSSRRGPQALRELTTWGERGFDLAITPDGPRGPAYVVQEGVVALAQLTGMPIVPVSYRLQWKIRLRSWDRFQVPLPFTRCDVWLGPELRVPPGIEDQERESFRRQLEERLRSLTRD